MVLGAMAASREGTPLLRDRVYGHIRLHPASHILEMAHHFRLTHPTLMYHLGLLERQGLVTSARHGKRRVHFDAHGRYSAWDREVLALLSVDEPRRILLRVAQSPGTWPRELARDLAMSETTVKRHLPDLLRLQVLQEEEGGFRRRLWPSPVLPRRASALLEKLPEGAPVRARVAPFSAPREDL